MFCCFDDGVSSTSAYSRTDNEQQYQPRIIVGGASSVPLNPNPSQVLVTVPPGIYPGQTIHVSAPDGSGQVIQAVVPPGMGPGSQFFVPFHSVPMGVDPVNVGVGNYYNSNNNNIATATYSGLYNNQAGAPPASQKYLRVRVPQGTPPGTVLSVQVPDEPGRFITAQVPPNVSEFHVPYYPNTTSNYYTTDGAGSGDFDDNYDNYRYNNINYNNQQQQQQRQGGGAGVGQYVVPALAGAAVGAAAVGLYDAFAGENDDDNDDGDEGDDDEDYD